MPEHLRDRTASAGPDAFACDRYRGASTRRAAEITIPRLWTRWRHDVGDALIAEHLAHTWFGRLSPDSYRAGPMSATEALGTRTDIAPVSGSQEACSPINNNRRRYFDKEIPESGSRQRRDFHQPWGQKRALSDSLCGVTRTCTKHYFRNGRKAPPMYRTVL